MNLPLRCDYFVEGRIRRPLSDEIGEIGFDWLSNEGPGQLIDNNTIEALFPLRGFRSKGVVQLSWDPSDRVVDRRFRMLNHVGMIARSACILFAILTNPESPRGEGHMTGLTLDLRAETGDPLEPVGFAVESIATRQNQGGR
jgi:hypothetical protein